MAPETFLVASVEQFFSDAPDAGPVLPGKGPTGLGPLTVRALQRWLGRAATGTLDRGTVVALQTRVGTSADGVWGRASMAALQAYLGISRDRAATWNARTVRQVQAYLATQL